ncbi:hypothetical protein MKW92_034012 [Papaver armeniacum]|nr:hypothetical protein MKW92_034012 [Papaver armeniacum]
MEGFQNQNNTTIPPISDKLNRNSPVEFVSKTYDMVDDPSTDDIISWSESNNSLVIWQPPELLARGLESFVKQLNNYGFKKVDHDRSEYANRDFLRGQKHLLKRIKRQEPLKVQKQQQQPQGQSSSVCACVEVGKFGLEEEIEILKRDKNVLMQEVVRLRQQQQSTDLQLQTLGYPGFLAQLVQKKNVNSRMIDGVNKKRRLPNLEDDSSTASDGHMIKYQPFLNEAAQAMLMQPNLASPSYILDVDTNGDSTQLDNGSTSNQISGVTHLEVAPTSGHSLLSVSLGYSGVRPSVIISEIQASGDVTDTPTTTTTSPLPDMSFFDALEKDLMQDMELENEGIEIPSADFVGHGDAYNDSLGVDDTISSFGSGQFSPDIDVDMLTDRYTTKPPGDRRIYVSNLSSMFRIVSTRFCPYYGILCVCRYFWK